jgi:hypothetical protein
MLLLSFLRYATVVVRRRMQSEWIFISLCDWHRQNETDKRKKKNCIMEKKTNETKKGEKRLYECMEILLQRPVRRRVRAATPPDPPPPTIEVRMWRGEGGICRLIFHNVIVAPESWTSLLISLTNFYSALWLGLCRVEPLSLECLSILVQLAKLRRLLIPMRMCARYEKEKQIVVSIHKNKYKMMRRRSHIKLHTPQM